MIDDLATVSSERPAPVTTLQFGERKSLYSIRVSLRNLARSALLSSCMINEIRPDLGKRCVTITNDLSDWFLLTGPLASCGGPMVILSSSFVHNQTVIQSCRCLESLSPQTWDSLSSKLSYQLLLVVHWGQYLRSLT